MSSGGCDCTKRRCAGVRSGAPVGRAIQLRPPPEALSPTQLGAKDERNFFPIVVCAGPSSDQIRPHGLCLKMTWRSAARHRSPHECFASSRRRQCGKADSFLADFCGASAGDLRSRPDNRSPRGSIDRSFSAKYRSPSWTVAFSTTTMSTIQSPQSAIVNGLQSVALIRLLCRSSRLTPVMVVILTPRRTKFRI